MVSNVELGFIVAALVITVVLGMLFIPIIRKAMNEPAEKNPGPLDI